MDQSYVAERVIGQGSPNLDGIVGALLERPELLQTIAATIDFLLEVPRGEGFDLERLGKFAAALSSSQYMDQYMHGAEKLPTHAALLDYALSKRMVEGLTLEFGVYKGKSVNQIADKVPTKVYGFDSFEGLPEDWIENHGKGTFAIPGLPIVRDNVELVVGWFDRTLIDFLDHNKQPVSFLHIDCDLYSSAQTVLMALRNRLQVGTIIVFDEYYNYRRWQLHEYKAFQELVRSTGLQYEYIGACTRGYSVAVRITGLGICGKN